jgi:hypothetical protein
MKKRKKIIGLSLVFLLFINLFSMTCIGEKKEINDNFLKKGTSSEILNENYDLLVLAPSNFKRATRPLIIHKNKIGVSTIFVSLRDIYQGTYYPVQGRDKAEQIKYFIKEALDNWHIKYVLLIGGRKNLVSPFETWSLPVRYSHIEDNIAPAGYPEKKYISDLYFSDIYDYEGNFSSWDNNGNKVFGEWLENKTADDIPDMYPDVYVGRLPCRNIFEVKIVVNKIINYEKEKCDNNWFRNMVVVGGDTTCTDDDHYEGEYSNQLAIEKMLDFNHIRLWTSLGTLAGPIDVIKAINKGCGFIYLAGHGNPRTWRTFPPNDNSVIITGLNIYQMPFLFNGKKLPVCIVGGCLNSMFNNSILHSSWSFGLPSSECWSWRLTRKIGGGAIAVIGNTGIGYGPEYRQNPSVWAGEDWLEVHFFEEYGINGTTILGELWGKTIAAYLDHFPINWNEKAFNDTAMDAKTVQQWVLIGDPSLKIGGYLKNIFIKS